MIAVRLVCALALATSQAAPAPELAAGVIVGMTGHVSILRAAANARTAAIGICLDAGDIVAVERGGSAEVYLRGGGVVHLKEATRFELPKGAAAPAQPTTESKIETGSIAQLESGLWVLNDPAGSLLVSPMRGDGSFGANDAIPLTPRYEALTQPRATFVWSGGPAKARVVVAKRRDVVWTSAPTAPGALLAPGAALPLTAGEAYTWWLEPEAGGPPLTAGIPFRIAAADVIARTKSIEAELSSDYLRLAYYAGAGSWTRVLELAGRLPAGEARDHALEAAAAGLRLDAKTTATLAAKLGAEPKP